MPSTKKKKKKKKSTAQQQQSIFVPFFLAEFFAYVQLMLSRFRCTCHPTQLSFGPMTPLHTDTHTHTPCRMLSLYLVLLLAMISSYSYLLTTCLTLSHIELSLAYETLSKPSSRFVYDSTGGSSGKSMLGSDETLQSVLSQVFFEFMDGDFEVIRNMISKWGLQTVGDMVNACSRHAQLK